MDTKNTPPTPADTGDNTNTTAPARPWPGDREWNDDRYKQFVQLYSHGAFPEIADDPTAWDQHFIYADFANNGDDSQRPTLISHHDFHHHLPAAHRGGPGFLVLKLWETARAKGYTQTFEQQIEAAARQQAEAEKQQLRHEIQNLKDNLPTPTPSPPVDPRRQWYEKILAAALPGAKLIEKVKHVQQTVLDGQPYRNSLLTDAANQLIEDIFGPLMLPESHDPLADPFQLMDPWHGLPAREQETSETQPNLQGQDAPATFETAEPDPPLRKWTAEANTTQIVNGAARDLADLVSLLIARQRVVVGFEADHKTIHEVRQLSRSLRELTQIIHQTELIHQAKKRGRPRKERLVHPELMIKYEK